MLLKQINIVPDEIIPADAVEVHFKDELLSSYVKRLDMERAQLVPSYHP